MSPGLELGHLEPLLALLHRQVVQLFRHLVFRVPDLRAVAQGTGIEPEEGDVADVGFRRRLEDPRDQPGVDRHGEFGRSGQQLDQAGEQGAYAVGELGAAYEERDDRPGHDGFLERRDDLGPRDFFAVQVSLDQGVVRRGHRLDQQVSVLLHFCHVLGRHVHFVVLARLGAGLVDVGLAGKEVDDSPEGRPLADGDLDREDLGRQVRFHVGEDPLEVRVVLVHLAHEEHARQVQLVADLPPLLGADLDATHTAHHHDRRVRRVQRRDYLAEEVEIARGVEQVELGVHPLGVGQAEADRVLAGDFVGSVIGEGRAVLDVPVAPAGTRDKGEGVHQSRLAAPAVAHKRHVPDCIRAIDTHGLHLLLFRSWEFAGQVPGCQTQNERLDEVTVKRLDSEALRIA